MATAFSNSWAPSTSGDSRIVNAYGLSSRGDGNFDTLIYNACTSPIDFNGDEGRADCLDGGMKQFEAGPERGRRREFQPRLRVGQELAGTGIGFVVADINGDGRQDILRWEDDSSKNVVYLSNGDGTFTASTSFNLANTQLQKSDGSANLVASATSRATATPRSCGSRPSRLDRHQPALRQADIERRRINWSP